MMRLLQHVLWDLYRDHSEEEVVQRGESVRNSLIRGPQWDTLSVKIHSYCVMKIAIYSSRFIIEGIK